MKPSELISVLSGVTTAPSLAKLYDDILSVDESKVLKLLSDRQQPVNVRPTIRVLSSLGEAIEPLAKKGLRAWTIAAKLGISESTVYLTVKRDGIRLRRGGHRRLTAETVQQIYLLRESGKSVVDIATIVDKAPVTVEQVLGGKHPLSVR